MRVLFCLSSENRIYLSVPSGEAEDLITKDSVLYPNLIKSFNFCTSSSLFSVVLILLLFTKSI